MQLREVHLLQVKVNISFNLLLNVNATDLPGPHWLAAQGAESRADLVFVDGPHALTATDDSLAAEAGAATANQRAWWSWQARCAASAPFCSPSAVWHLIVHTAPEQPHSETFTVAKPLLLNWTALSIKNVSEQPQLAWNTLQQHILCCQPSRPQSTQTSCFAFATKMTPTLVQNLDRYWL